MANRLASATSPYLLQHAQNPVDWWEWGPEAFAEARARDVPIFLSVGYAACHWCHVMAHESFEDEDVARVLNDGFVAIKVDREERPDVDSAYMAATTALTGRGGWPMSVWLDHDGRPFYAGTYFPPRSRPGMPGFTEVLTAVSEAWTNRRGDVERTAGQVQEVLARRRDAPRAFADRAAMSAAPDLAQVTADAVVALADEFDPARGGFGGAPKFPPSMVLEFLLRHHARTGDPAALDMVAATCSAMARGGMYDQLGGGFARYSVDADWVVPHFEKMLYDNAQLLRVYAHWWRLTGDPLARRVAGETAEFLLRDLRTPEGGFASALDADSLPAGASAQGAYAGAAGASAQGAYAGAAGASAQGAYAVEGAAYVWTPTQLIDVLGPDDGTWAAALLGVTAAGTFEHGASTLQLRTDPDDPQRWDRVRARLLAARDTRPAPARDDKVVSAWNGLAIAALAEAGAILGHAEWIEAAESAADLLLAVHLTDDGGLLRVSRGGTAGRSKAVLEDFSDVADGFLALYWATGAAEWFELAEDLLGGAVGRFDSGVGVFVDNEPDGILAAESDPGDNAYPSGSSALAAALLSVAALGGGSPTDLRATVESMVAAQVPVMANHPRFAGWWLAVAEALLAGPLEVAVVGDPDDPATEALAQVARQSPAPGLVLAVGAPGDVVPPLLVEREPRDGRATAYVCRGFVCEQPTDSAADLSAQLRS